MEDRVSPEAVQRSGNHGGTLEGAVGRSPLVVGQGTDIDGGDNPGPVGVGPIFWPRLAPPGWIPGTKGRSHQGMGLRLVETPGALGVVTIEGGILSVPELGTDSEGKNHLESVSIR